MNEDYFSTNDDGYFSEGIKVLHDSIIDLGKTLIIAPEGLQSFASMSLTFHKSLGILKTVTKNTLAYVVSGSPADTVILGIHSIFEQNLILLSQELIMETIAHSKTVPRAV